MTAQKPILVTGASGYIAGLLIPRLLAGGYTVRAMARDDSKLANLPWRKQVDVVCADVAEPETLAHALKGVHTAYYLIHNMSSGQGYHRKEVEGAHNFAQAASEAGVEHIIYLGGLAAPQNDIAPHMNSRIETGNVLRQNQVPVTEFRAGVIVGPGSISFEMIRYLAEQFPILVGPPWLKNKTQPISAKNVVDYLMAALENPDGRGEILEIGGPDVMTYAETMTSYCRARRLRRPIFIIPYIPTSLMAFMVDKLTPVRSSIAYPLIGGLQSASVVSDPRALQIFPQIKPQGFDEAVRQSLDKLHPHQISQAWQGQHPHMTHIKSQGFLIACEELHTITQPQDLFSRLLAFAETTPGCYQVELVRQNESILMKDTLYSRGNRWVEWKIFAEKTQGSAILRQTGFFAPRGLAGFLSRPRWQSSLRKIFSQAVETIIPGRL